MKKSLYERFAFSASRFYCAFQGNKMMSYYNTLKKNENLSSVQLQEKESEGIRRIVNYAYSSVPYYRDLFNSKGIDPSKI